MNVARTFGADGGLADRPDFGAVFHLHYPRIAGVIVGMVQDPGRAEELAGGAKPIDVQLEVVLNFHLY